MESEELCVVEAEIVLPGLLTGASMPSTEYREIRSGVLSVIFSLAVVESKPSCTFRSDDII